MKPHYSLRRPVRVGMDHRHAGEVIALRELQRSQRVPKPSSFSKLIQLVIFRNSSPVSSCTTVFIADGQTNVAHCVH